MGPEVANKNKDSVFYGPYAGRDLYITMFQDNEREFVVTHNANIKPVSYFTGRETELQDLRQRIEDGRKSVLVSGMGGIGKTHICRKLFEEYLKKHAQDEKVPFQHISYIEYSGDMDGSLQNCLKFKKQESAEQNREAAWKELEYLASDGRLLLFVDNVDKSMRDDLGLQRLKSIPGAIVLTSRQTSFGDEFEPYRINFLSIEQCKVIYNKIMLFVNHGRTVKSEEDQDLEYVIDKLAGRHTITVEFLAHLACTKHWDVKKLRDELEQKGFKLEFHNTSGELINIQQTYEVFYDLSMLTEAEQNILEAFSVFPYIPLAFEICNQWLLADAGVCKDDDILARLYQNGWLQFDKEQAGYSMHPVFAQFIYERNKPSVEMHLGLLESCKKHFDIPENGSVLEYQRLIPFAESMIKKLDMKEYSEQFHFITTIADLLLYIAEYGKAKKLYEKSLLISEVVFGEEHLNTATSYNNLAGVYRSLGEYEEAEKLWRKSLQINQRVLGEEHPYTATSYNNLAGLYESQGKHPEAKILYEKSLRIRIRILGENHLDTAASYNNLAGVYNSLGNYEKAKELYKKSLQVNENVLGENHPDTATNYNNLAVIYDSQGEYKKAKELHERSLGIRERVLGENHPDTAISYNNLSIVYQEIGDYEKAKELCEKSLQIRKRVFGEDHPNTALSYNTLAGMYKAQGEYKKAEEMYKKSLCIREKVLGENHPDTATSYNNLAVMYWNLGNYKEAKELYEKSLRIRERILGENHPDFATCCNNLATVYQSQGEYEKAEKMFKESLHIYISVLGGEHPYTVLCYNNLAEVYREQGDYIKAEKLYKKSLQIYKKKLNEEHPDIATCYNNLAEVYRMQGKYEKAKILFEKSLQISRKVLNLDHPDMAISYNNLAWIYAHRGEYEIALDFYYKAYSVFVSKFGPNHPDTEAIYENIKTSYIKWKPNGDFEVWLSKKHSKQCPRTSDSA